ncbi:hypothetical protein DBT46_003765, partial [Aerococcus mictus]
FTGAVVTEVIVALLVFRRLRPIQEIVFLLLRLLGEEVVGKAADATSSITMVATAKSAAGDNPK